MKSSRATTRRVPPKPSAAASAKGSQSSVRSGPQDWDPDPYQLEAAKFMVSRGSAGLFLDPGLRKTSITLAAVSVLLRKKMVRRVLVVAPPRVCRRVWPAEAAKWRDFLHLRVVNLHGRKKEDLLLEDADIYCVSFEGLAWLLGVEKLLSAKTGKVKVKLHPERLKALGVDMLVVDELAKAKNYNSLRFKILKEARELFTRVYGLTGSPMARDMQDLFAEMYILDGGYSLGPYITHYRREFFYPTGYGGYTYELKDGAEAKIHERIALFAFRLGEKDLLKLPKLILNDIVVDLPPEARRVYDELEKDLFTMLNEEGHRAANKAAALSKCRQVANGGLFKPQYVDEDGRLPSGPREWVPLHSAKTEAVEELSSELGSAPALVAYHFGHDLARLKAMFKREGFGDVPHIGGGVTGKAGDKLVDLWNAGKLPRLLVHPASMGHGLNMQEGHARHVVLHSLIDSYDDYDQLVRRVRRSGNEAASVTVHRIIAKDTVDEAIIGRNETKESRQQTFFEAIREYTIRRHGKKRLGLLPKS